MFRKNVASQVVGAQMVTAANGSAFTGAVTCYVTGDGGTQAAGSVGSGACTHEGNGYHTYVPAQAETNYETVAYTFVGTGAIPVTVQLFPDTLKADLATVDSNVDAILDDTGTSGVLVNAIANNAITASAIANGAITDAKFGTTPLTAGVIADAVVAGFGESGLGSNIEDTYTLVSSTGVVVAAASKTGYALSATGLDAVIPPDPASIPVPGTSNLKTWIGYVGAWMVNEVDATGSAVKLRNSADNADLATHTVSDDGTTFVSSEPS